MGNHELPHPLLLYDGVCNLCNGLVSFVIRRDPAPGRFRFSALQSPYARGLLEAYGLPSDLNTFVFIENGRAYVRSAAALRVLLRLGFPWLLAYGGIVVPRPLRDALYDAVARRRYGWFGRRATCMVPTPEIRARFIE